MRKIVFNGFEFARNKEPAGIVRHSYEVLKELDKLVPPGQVVVLMPRCGLNISMFHNIRFVSIGKLRKSNDRINHMQNILWRYIVFPIYCQLCNAFTINTATTWRFFNFNVISIYDCTQDLFYLNSNYGSHYNKFSSNLVRNQKAKTKTCDFVITDSYSAKADICKLYDLPEEKVEVVPCAWQHFNAIEEDDSILDKLGLRGKVFFFSLGSRMPHKNIKWVGYAARRHPQYGFVVTGSSRGETSFEGEIPDNMIFTGYLKDEEIKALMHYCKAFIQPTFYEGFGIPPMEAMSVGANCIVSHAGSLPEVYKNSVWYIDPYDYNNIDLDEIMSKPKESNEVVLNEYSWEKSAKIMFDILQRRVK